jgi:hypothetical protein
MTHKLHALLGGVALATAMAASAPAFAEAGDFDAWDADSSGVLTLGEWDNGFDDESLLSSWDGDRNGSISDEEYGEGLFNTYDADHSGDWNEDEYNAFRDDADDSGWLDA